MIIESIIKDIAEHTHAAMKDSHLISIYDNRGFMILFTVYIYVMSNIIKPLKAWLCKKFNIKNSDDDDIDNNHLF